MDYEDFVYKEGDTKKCKQKGRTRMSQEPEEE